MRVRALAGAVAALLCSAGCSAQARGEAPAPRGMLFAAGPYVQTDHGWLPPRDTRVYRDGRLITVVHARVLPARDRAARSLLYDELGGKARPIGGGAWRPWDPCPASYHVSGRTVALSPDGRRGLCVSVEGSDYDWLFVFDPARPNATRRRVFKTSGEATDMAGWLDDERIAVQQYRPYCPRVFKRMPAGVAIIDVRGRVLEQGACAHGVLAGPHGPILVKEVTDWRGWTRVMHALLGEPVSRTAFSPDGGRSWRGGRPQFADADGRVFYFDERVAESTLQVDGRPTPIRNVSEAGWAN